jgi:hypothetical protein
MLPYEDDFQHFTRVAQLFLDWFRTTAIESDHALYRLSRVRKQIDEPFDAFVIRYEQCVNKAHPTSDLASATRFDSASRASSPISVEHGIRMPYNIKVKDSRPPLHDRLLHRSEGLSIAVTLLSLLCPSLILLQTSPLFQWTRHKHLLEFSVVPDFPFVLTTMSRSSSVNQLLLLTLSTLLPIASANG